MKKTLLVIALAALALGACSPVVYSVPTDPIARTKTPKGVEARPSATVKLYIGDAPTCAYRELAFIEGNSRLTGSASDTLEKMRTEAAKYGADALVLLTHGDSANGHESSGDSYHKYSAVAVSFTGAVCPKQQSSKNERPAVPVAPPGS